MGTQKIGIRKTRTTPYHPQSNGMVERFMRILKDMVAKYIDTAGFTWDKGVKAYAMAYNSAAHDTTGYSPFFLVHGFEPRLPMDTQFDAPRAPVDVQSFPEERRREMEKAFADVRRTTQKAASKAARRCDEPTRHTTYQVGDKVWVRDHTASVGGKPKLGMLYKGPGTIIRAVGETGKEVTYKVRVPGVRDRVVHHNDLKPLIQRTNQGCTPQYEEEVTPGLVRPVTNLACDEENDGDLQSASSDRFQSTAWAGQQTMPHALAT